MPGGEQEALRMGLAPQGWHVQQAGARWPAAPSKRLVPLADAAGAAGAPGL